MDFVCSRQVVLRPLQSGMLLRRERINEGGERTSKYPMRRRSWQTRSRPTLQISRRLLCTAGPGITTRQQSRGKTSPRNGQRENEPIGSSAYRSTRARIGQAGRRYDPSLTTSSRSFTPLSGPQKGSLGIVRALACTEHTTEELQL